MKPLHAIGGLVGIAIVLLAGCGTVAQLVLDDTWTLEQIKTGDLITTDLDDYLQVTFDAESETATIVIGTDWDDLSDLQVAGTFGVTIDSDQNSITLSEDGVDRYRITYELEEQLTRMVWTRWIAVDVDPEVDIVGGDAIIEHIAFIRES
ncbi:MAG: hypothetical protein ACOC0Y_02040 [Spirochaetota bacterium]